MKPVRTFLIDFLNVAHLKKHNGIPTVNSFKLVRKKILSLDPIAKIFGIADPSSPFKVNSIEKYEKLRDAGIIRQIGPGEKADPYMIKFAESRPHCCIITNDKFEDYAISDELRKTIIAASQQKKKVGRPKGSTKKKNNV